MPGSSKSIFKGSFVLVFFATTLLFTAFYLLLPTLPVFITRELKIDEGKTGIILAVYTLAALLIRPFTGYMLDRYGRKYFYILSFLLFSLVFVYYPLAGIFFWMLVVRFMHGMLWGVVTTAGSTIIVDIVPPQRRGEGLGLFGLAMTIPMAVGPFLGLQLTQNSNYTLMFWCSGIISLAGFILALLIRYPVIPLSDKQTFKWRNLIEYSSLPVTFNLLLINISYGGLVSFISIYSITTGIGLTGLFFIVFAVGITLARLYMGRIFDRRGPKILAIAGILMLVTGNFILGLLINQTSFLIAGFILGLGSGIIFPAFQAMVNNLVPPHRRGAANSTLFSGLDLGIGLGMIITGMLAQSLGLPLTYLIYGVFNLLALLYFIFISLVHYQKQIKYV